MNLLLKLNCYALGVCAAAALGANTEPVPQAQPQGERPAIRIPIDGLGEQLEQATDAVDQATKALEGITGAVEEPAADGLLKRPRPLLQASFRNGQTGQ